MKQAKQGNKITTSDFGLIARIFPVQKDEWSMLLRSGACFFFLLLGYFLLRSLREAMGVERSMSDLRWLFLITCGVSLIITLAFSSIVSKFHRSKFIPLAFRIIMLCLVAFIALRSFLRDDALLYVGYVFYVWLSVINLFMVSVFWGFMVDNWSLEQCKRLFAAIGVGGTLGAMLGSNIVWLLAEEIGPLLQMGIAILMFEIAVQLIKSIDRNSTHTTEGHLQVDNQDSTLRCRSWWSGMHALLRSPYMLGIGLYIMLLAVSNTLLYFTQAQLVVNATSELTERVSLFAQLDMWTQLATLMVQLFVTVHLIKRLGIGITLSILPAITVVGFVVLAWVSRIPSVESWQLFGVFALFNAIHRATRYAVIRPARETLFSVVPTAQKYKAKPIVDVFLYRGGDVAGAGVEYAITAAGFALAGVAMAVMPLVVIWSGLAIMLSVSQQRKSQTQIQ